ncbi:SGNH/GDSL hydrolase family protein [Luteimonas aquatica]|uniref:SGNH/GDSL hydrolase family protein n=1 Tax=Luteimonas aquatica TaxID=450364 RepID=UPI001F5742B5|nr:SGNH/GDSL hydrolase family protein [Luteimonas aquatica]
MALLRPFVLALAALWLAGGCATPPAPGRTAAHAEAALDPVSSPDWAGDMARFAAEDGARPPPAHPVVFTGSSSVRLWTALAEDFPGIPVLNRGFGGSQLRDAVWYADQVAVRYRPSRIVLYAGDNDINAGRTPEQVSADFRAFVARIRRDLPRVPIVLLAIKPSLARLPQLPAQQRANALLAADAAALPGVSFVDVATPMLDAAGRPRAELFVEDGLHMNRRGYDLWRGILAPHLR